MNIKNWKLAPLDKAKAAEIADRYSLPAILAMLLQIRGADDERTINELIGEPPALDDPYMLKDMDRAVDRIIAALERSERIAVYGDYDADGITSTAIVYTYLRSKNGDVIYYIPNREGEGYGLNINAIDFLKEQGVNLIITVDNGISSIAEIERAKELGIDVVITDHHRPHEILPDAVAVVDPYQKDCPSEFKDFSGAGLAFKLIYALETDLGDPEDLLSEYSDLSAIGTIGDIVPLRGENRTIVKYGLALLSQSKRFGINALLQKASSSDRELTSNTVAFTLVPRINATGRMGAPDRAVDLLICEDAEDSLSLAEEICEDNTRRREVEAKITEQVISVIERDETLKYSRVIVIAGENWHHGVIGIVAARITDRYGKPCMILSSSGDETKGSGRSVEGFNLFDAITYCQDLLVKFGGHPMAAGVTMRTNQVQAFREKINEYARIYGNVMPTPSINIDCKLHPSALSAQLPQVLKVLEPYGAGNPSPVFGLYSMQLTGIVPVGGGNHLRLSLSRNGTNITCMKFSTSPSEFPYSVGAVLDLAVSLESKIFRGTPTLTVLVRDMKPSSVNLDESIASYRVYEKFKISEPMSSEEISKIIPNRDDLALLYRFFRNSGGYRGGVLQLLACVERINLGKLLLSLDILEERSLLLLEKQGEILEIAVPPASGKMDIFSSSIFAKLQTLCQTPSNN